MSKDVILDKYARLYEIPNQLALLDHEVNCYCLSYQNHDEGFWDESSQSKQLGWYSKSYQGCKKLNIWSYPFILLQKLKINKPDVIIAASDIPHIIIGAWLAKKLNLPFVADLYDNFEAYGQAKIPLIKTLFHRALDQAKLIVTTSYTLADKIRSEHPQVPNILPMPSVINKDLFKIGNKQQARKLLSLPLDKKLIGTAGGLTKMKGIDDLFRAWEIIKNSHDDVYLVLAGPTEKQTKIPDDDRVIYLGLLPHEAIVYLFQALDVGVLCIPDDLFGQYCFPQKAYEMMATQLPIVSTAIGDMTHLLKNTPHMLYAARNEQEFASNVMKQLEICDLPNVKILDWKQSVMNLSNHLHNL
jgi:glycosyltransferase involved in cell wall biosynthesis